VPRAPQSVPVRTTPTARAPYHRAAEAKKGHVCISAAVPNHVATRETIVTGNATRAVQVQSIVRLTAAVIDAAGQQTIISRPAGPCYPEESRIALHV
jgi:hypothetical protein